jgi:hypothetical protein
LHLLAPVASVALECRFFVIFGITGITDQEASNNVLNHQKMIVPRISSAAFQFGENAVLAESEGIESPARSGASGGHLNLALRNSLVRPLAR